MIKFCLNCRLLWACMKHQIARFSAKYTEIIHKHRTNSLCFKRVFHYVFSFGSYVKFQKSFFELILICLTKKSWIDKKICHKIDFRMERKEESLCCWDERKQIKLWPKKARFDWLKREENVVKREKKTRHTNLNCELSVLEGQRSV